MLLAFLYFFLFFCTKSCIVAFSSALCDINAIYSIYSLAFFFLLIFFLLVFFLSKCMRFYFYTYLYFFRSMHICIYVCESVCTHAFTWLSNAQIYTHTYIRTHEQNCRTLNWKTYFYTWMLEMRLFSLAFCIIWIKTCWAFICKMYTYVPIYLYFNGQRFRKIWNLCTNKFFRRANIFNYLKI